MNTHGHGRQMYACGKHILVQCCIEGHSNTIMTNVVCPKCAGAPTEVHELRPPKPQKVWVGDSDGNKQDAPNPRAEVDAVMESGDPIFVIHMKLYADEAESPIRNIAVWTAEPPNEQMLNILIRVVKNYGALVEHYLREQAREPDKEGSGN